MIYLFRLVQVVSQLYFYCILANVILSWIPHNRFNPIFRFIHEITDPYLNFFRTHMPFLRYSTIDFSPIVALLALEVAAQLVLCLILLLV